MNFATLMIYIIKVFIVNILLACAMLLFPQLIVLLD